MKGQLFLIPTLLAEETHYKALPPLVIDSMRTIHYFLCENVRTARRFVSSLKVHESIEVLRFEVLDKDTKPEALFQLMAPLQQGENIGVMSESGCPGIADPGALAVAYAHAHGIRVKPLVGPSSILLALMASGLNGQQFAFHGYLPIESQNAAAAIKMLERESREKKQTQIFIETPFRNNALMAHLLGSLRGDTRLCVAVNLTADLENIACKEVSLWKKNPVVLEKVPAVFLFMAAS